MGRAFGAGMHFTPAGNAALALTGASRFLFFEAFMIPNPLTSVQV